MSAMSEKKSSLEKARGEGRMEIVAVLVMAAASTRTMMKSLRTARAMLTRQMYIRSLEIKIVEGYSHHDPENHQNNISYLNK